jgi:hypothetical protein
MTTKKQSMTVKPQAFFKAPTLKSSQVKVNSAPVGPPQPKIRSGVKVPGRLAQSTGTRPIVTGPKAITSNSKLELQTVVPCENITANSLLVTVQACAVGIISYALQRGFGQQVIDPSGAFFAYVYLVNMMTSAMRNATPTVQFVPKFLKKILDSIKPKRVGIGAGSVGYVWTTDFDPLSTSYIYNMAPSAAPRDWNIGNVGATTVNGLLHVIDPPTAYNEVLGERAWTILLQFLENIHGGGDTRLVNYMGGKDSKYLHDGSAFAVGDQNIGTSGSTNGGYAVNRQSEVPILHPLFAVFASNSANTLQDPYRCPAYSVMGSGDACSLGATLASGFNEKLDRGRLAPIIKDLDFHRFCDVIGRWMAKVAQTAYDDVQVFSGVWQRDTTYLTCGLTFQEFKILMRNLLMNNFQDSQLIVQNNLPGDSLNVVNNFLPFVSGQGTCPVEATNMQLPAFFIENLRSCTARSQNAENPFTILPSLGIYELDQLDGDDYFYTSITEPTQGPIGVFTTPTLKEVIDEKTKKPVKVSAETTISMVDGSFGGGYAALNSPYALNVYVNAWNDWVDKVKPFTSDLTTLGRDGGIAGLQVIPFTQLTFQNQLLNGKPHPSMIPTKHHVVTHDIPARLQKNTLAIGNYYADRLVETVTCSQAPIANVFQTVQSLWILPEMSLYGTGNLNEKLSVSKWQSIAREYNAIKYTPGDDNFSLQQQHDQYAATMVKARNGQDNMAVSLVKDMELKGRGGIFASVLGGLGKVAVNVLAAPGVIDGITGMIPF